MTANKKRDQAVRAMIDTLAETYPAAFAVFQKRRRPLKLGIHSDIIAGNPDIDQRLLSRALEVYTRNPYYLRACVEGADRRDLGGNPAGQVSPEHAKASVDKLEGVLASQRKRTQPAPPAPMKELLQEAGFKVPEPHGDGFIIPAPAPRRISLADLRASAAARKRVA